MAPPRLINYVPHLTASELIMLETIDREMDTLRRARQRLAADIHAASERRQRIVNRASMRARSELGL